MRIPVKRALCTCLSNLHQVKGYRSVRTPKEKRSLDARKIAVILHRMWVDGTTYRWTNAQPTAVQV